MRAKLRDPKALKRTIVAVTLLLGLYLYSTTHPTTFWLNLTDSEPVGLYRVHQVQREIQRGEMVIFSVPQEFRQYVYGRGWVPEGWPLLKHVGGVAGDIFCVSASWLTINGRQAGPIYRTDQEGRPLPHMEGCRTVPAGCFLPLATHISRSFDGRYMGAVKLSAIQGVARPLLTFD